MGCCYDTWPHSPSERFRECMMPRANASQRRSRLDANRESSKIRSTDESAATFRTSAGGRPPGSSKLSPRSALVWSSPPGFAPPHDIARAREECKGQPAEKAADTMVLEGIVARLKDCSGEVKFRTKWWKEVGGDAGGTGEKAKNPGPCRGGCRRGRRVIGKCKPGLEW